MDNANLVKRLKSALDLLGEINEGGESTMYANKASDEIDEVIKELELGIDDGK